MLNNRVAKIYSLCRANKSGEEVCDRFLITLGNWVHVISELLTLFFCKWQWGLEGRWRLKDCVLIERLERQVGAHGSFRLRIVVLDSSYFRILPTSNFQIVSKSIGNISEPVWTSVFQDSWEFALSASRSLTALPIVPFDFIHSTINFAPLCRLIYQSIIWSSILFEFDLSIYIYVKFNSYWNWILNVD